MQAAHSKQARARRKRADTTLIFDPAQKAPGPVLDAILEEWLVPTLVEQFLRERGVTRESLLTRYRTLE
jgi:hypothetical protein